MVVADGESIWTAHPDVIAASKMPGTIRYWYPVVYPTALGQHPTLSGYYMCNAGQRRILIRQTFTPGSICTATNITPLPVRPRAPRPEQSLA